jgi:hypothetical protein
MAEKTSTQSPRDALLSYLSDACKLAGDDKLADAVDEIQRLAEDFVARSRPDARKRLRDQRSRDANEMEAAAKRFKDAASLLASPPTQWRVLSLRDAPSIYGRVKTRVAKTGGGDAEGRRLSPILPPSEVEADLRAYEYMCRASANILRDLNTSTAGGPVFFAQSIQVAHDLGHAPLGRTKQQEQAPRLYGLLCQLVRHEEGKALDGIPSGLRIDSWHKAIEVLKDPMAHQLLGVSEISFHKRQTEASQRKAAARKERRALKRKPKG